MKNLLVSMMLILTLSSISCKAQEEGKVLNQQSTQEQKKIYRDDVVEKSKITRVTMEIVKFEVIDTFDDHNWIDSGTGRPSNIPILRIHVIGKTSTYTPKDSITVSLEYIETTQKPVLTPNYIPLNYIPEYKAMETKVPANCEHTFETDLEPITNKSTVEKRLEEARVSGELVTFISTTQSEFMGERCYGIEFKKSNNN